MGVEAPLGGVCILQFFGAAALAPAMHGCDAVELVGDRGGGVRWGEGVKGARWKKWRVVGFVIVWDCYWRGVVGVGWGWLGWLWVVDCWYGREMVDGACLVVVGGGW